MPNLPDNWTIDKDAKKASVEVETKDFLTAMSVINDVAAIAEEIEHHPDLHLTEWNQLRIDTWSHDVGELTARDERLAEAINGVLRKHRLLG